jgi:hypothetical protein
MNIDMQHLPVHAAYPSPCCRDKSVLCVHVHVVCCMSSSYCLYCKSISMLHVCCPCCIFMSILHGHVHTAWPCPCCMSSPCYMSISMLHVQSMLHVHIHAACPCPCCISIPCCMSVSMLNMETGKDSGHGHRHGQEHGADRHMDMDTDTGQTHLACTWTSEFRESVYY